MKKVVAIVLGTRPEIIKLAPVLFALRSTGKIEPKIIFTGQHSSMAEQAFEVFEISPDIDLKVMSPNQTPNTVLGALLPKLEQTFKDLSPCGVIVQGDTTSALAGALASFHLKIPIAHVEAGLRTFDLHSPFPEEMNRSLISKLANIHFCPTIRAVENLNQEGIKENIWITGNTVVDALLYINTLLEENKVIISENLKSLCEKSREIILVTGHRRENFDRPLLNLCEALKQIALANDSVEIVYPVHLNPNVQGPVHKTLAGISRIHLLNPLSYPELIYLLKHCTLVISDSGGIQEEAPSFNKRILVTRNHTERPEAIEANFATLVSLDDPSELKTTALNELNISKNKACSRQFTFKTKANPFGDGNAAKQIATALMSAWMN
jgi:UDP-N-acetylglucosamine 2-epimerase